LTGSAGAAGILRRGQEKGEGRSGNTDEPFDEPAAEKTASLRLLSGGRPPRRKARPMDTASLFVLLLADRRAGQQRRLFPAKKIRL